MPDDPITIDAEFHPHQSKDSERRVPWLIVVAVVAAGGLFGWLLASPYSADSDEPEAAVLTSIPTPTPSTSPSAVISVPASAPSALAEFSESLSNAVPGFTDEIVMLATPPESFKVIRWLPTERATSAAFSLDRLAEYGSSPVGLDASGRWFADIDHDGILTVHSIPEARASGREREAVGLTVASARWHDTDAGALAWISCGRPQTAPATLTTLNVSDPEAAPIPVRTFEENCQEWSGGAWLERWGDDGFLVGTTVGAFSTNLLVDLDGAVVDVESAASEFATDADGRVRSVIPGLADQEPVADVAWSPDGTLAAVVIDEHWDNEVPKLRVTRLETGQALTEIAEHDAVVFAMTWSTDGRFLIYELWNFDTETGALAFYDTVTNATVRTPVGEVIDEIRTLRSPS